MRGTSIHHRAPAGSCELLPQRRVTGHFVTSMERVLNRSWEPSPEHNVEEPSCFREGVFMGLNFFFCSIHSAKWYMFVHNTAIASRGRSISSLFQNVVVCFFFFFFFLYPMQFVLSAMLNILGK